MAFLKALCFSKALELVAPFGERQGGRRLAVFQLLLSRRRAASQFENRYLIVLRKPPPLGQSPEV